MRATILALALALSGSALEASAPQFPRGLKERVAGITDRAQKLIDVRVTEEEEIRLGNEVSARVRARYGVVQDPKIHEYVSLAGSVLVKASTRSTLPFHFVVLDTDGVNAFAAPGGYIHITRGALSIMTDESQLAGVLAHEIGHVTKGHAIKVVQNKRLVQMGAGQTSVGSSPEVFQRLVEACTKIVMAGFGRTEELESDVEGVELTARTGYAATGLEQFFRILKKRNADSEQQQGLFASHPEIDGRIEKLVELVSAQNLTGGVLVKDRFAKNVTYKPTELAMIALIEEGTSGLAGGGKTEGEKAGTKKPGRFSLARLKNPLGGGEETKQSAAVTGSGGSRGVDRERQAMGGSNPALVAVKIGAADVERFRKEGGLK